MAELLLRQGMSAFIASSLVIVGCSVYKLFEFSLGNVLLQGKAKQKANSANIFKTFLTKIGSYEFLQKLQV